jgi:hypothetical protein
MNLQTLRQDIPAAKLGDDIGFNQPVKLAALLFLRGTGVIRH